MKFRYYITSMFDGNITGTNDTSRAVDYAECEDFFVVDTETGEWLTPDGPANIEEKKA